MMSYQTSAGSLLIKGLSWSWHWTDEWCIPKGESLLPSDTFKTEITENLFHGFDKDFNGKMRRYYD